MNRHIHPVELALLLGLAFFLPLAEAPKNVFLFGFILFWVGRSAVLGNLGSAPLLFWLPLVGIVLLSWLSVLNLTGNKWTTFLNTLDFLSIALLTIAVARSQFSAHARTSILLSLVAGVLASLVEGELRGGRFPSLKSVGHVNQTAIYLAIACAVSLSAFLTATSKLQKLCALAVFCAFSLFIVATGSRNAVYALALTSVVLTFLFLVTKDWRRALTLLSLFVFGGVALTLLRVEFVVKQRDASRVSQSVVDEARLRLWRGGLLVVEERPVLGYGVGNFGVAHSSANLRRVIEGRGEPFSEGSFLFTDHAHNLTLNWLIERGLIAVLLLYVWLAFVLSITLREVRAHTEPFWPLSAACAVLVSTFCGLGNTSWHHEHGILAGLIIGLGVSYVVRGSNRSSPLPRRDSAQDRCTS